MQRAPAQDAVLRTRHALVLWILFFAFGFRVLAQLVQASRPVTFLPPFEAWHSAALPYPLLVVVQLLIVVLYAWMARGISSGRTRPRPRLGRALGWLGGVYFAFMAARLVLGASVLRETWFDAPIPSGFHLVLASFLLVAGHYHRTGEL